MTFRKSSVIVVASFFLFALFLLSLSSAISCNADSECNDGNSSTFDECINPNTAASQCRNTQINCAFDSDCGITGFIASPYCSVDDVYQNFQNSTCINPGTLQSHCSIQITSKLVTMCSSGCDNGQCINQPPVAVCGNGQVETGEQCDDGNQNNNDACSNSCQTQTILCNTNIDCGNPVFTSNFCSNGNVVRNVDTPQCNNAGTAQAFCSSTQTLELIQQCFHGCSNALCNPAPNVTITCHTNTDCGVNVNSTNFCSSSNVVFNSTSFICNNAGTAQSFCTSSTNQFTLNTCSNGCSNGQCNANNQTNQTIRCQIDSDCNDNNSKTRDRCVNPGTPQSFCKNIKISSGGSSYVPYNTTKYSCIECVAGNKVGSYTALKAKSSNYTLYYESNDRIDLTDYSNTYESPSSSKFWIWFFLILSVLALVAIIIVLLVSTD